MDLKKTIGFAKQHWRPIFIFLIFVTAEWLVQPFRNFPLNDDWSYAKAVKLLYTHHIFNIGDWPAMSLFTHIIWGWLFVSVFGFSYSALHLSTLTAALAACLLMYDLVKKVSHNANAAFVASLVLMFCPITFNLSNTFMTDVPFNSLLILCLWLAHKYFSTEKIWALLLFFISSLLLMLLRQYGIIVPVCFLAVSFLYKQFRNRKLLFSVLLFLSCYGAFILYEMYLRSILPEGASYKFSGSVSFTEAKFIDTILANLKNRYPHILYHGLFYCFPFFIFFLPHQIWRAGLLKSSITIASSLIFIFYFLDAGNTILGNMWTDMSLGPATFYENMTASCCPYSHTFSGVYNKQIIPIKQLFVAGSFCFLMIVIFNNLRKKPGVFTALLLFLIPSYIFMLLLTESFFDRYHIPLISMILVLGSLISNHKGFLFPSLVCISIFAFVSISGTRDYLELKTKVQEAYDSLKKNNVPAQKINAGFELYFWENEGRVKWEKFADLYSFEYLIQYDKEPGFTPIKKYSFYSWFRRCDDTVVVFKNEHLAKDSIALHLP